MAKFTAPRPQQMLLRKPRNPHVAPSLNRSAGRHGPSTGARRQQAQQTLQRELRHLHELSP
ncbi:hypothetical protein SAMN05216359_102712 [Roseateles sp. YR242]|uniref:hypothetical protein n=1 Tax=Roseateles sp. YR242 TaxID=1855305 RepID=UPI0008B315A5|nr:hypothetical protein [Roseateles sp. YR242]SEK69918.1 hypothetical protein SAMN05216359_102712 [Roseateles sp. YR242]